MAYPLLYGKCQIIAPDFRGEKFENNFMAMRASRNSDPLVTALLEIAKVRFALFRERFGRDPRPDEPLLFDPDKDEPTAATGDDGRIQLVSAAIASEVDATPVLGLLGYEYLH